MRFGRKALEFDLRFDIQTVGIDNTSVESADALKDLKHKDLFHADWDDPFPVYSFYFFLQNL